MENSTLATQQQTLFFTTPILGNNVEPWKIAVPVVLLLLLAAVVFAAALLVLYYYKKCYKTRSVFPVIIIDEVSNHSRSIVTQIASTTRKDNSVGKKPSIPNVVQAFKLADFEEEFQATRTKSLTVLVPEGESIVFSYACYVLVMWGPGRVLAGLVALLYMVSHYIMLSDSNSISHSSTVLFTLIDYIIKCNSCTS